MQAPQVFFIFLVEWVIVMCFNTIRKHWNFKCNLRKYVSNKQRWLIFIARFSMWMNGDHNNSLRKLFLMNNWWNTGITLSFQYSFNWTECVCFYCLEYVQLIVLNRSNIQIWYLFVFERMILEVNKVKTMTSQFLFLLSSWKKFFLLD